MNTVSTLKQGREAYRRQDWSGAHLHLSIADREKSLGPEDIEKLAVTAYLIGKESECIELWTRAHKEFKRRGNMEHACRCAFWTGFILMIQGEGARGGGWFSRAGRLLEENDLDCVIQGFLLVPQALQCLRTGDAQSAYDLFNQASDKIFYLPAPKEFLWQYIHSTPLLGVIAESDEESQKALESKVIDKWKSFEKKESMLYQQRIVTVMGMKK